VTGRIPVAPRLLRLAVVIFLLLGLAGCPRPSVSAGDEWKVNWSAPGQDISEWHNIQVRNKTTDRIQSLTAPAGGIDRAFKFSLWNNDVALTSSCGGTGDGWRAEGIGPTEKVSDRLIRYEWNTWFEQSFPASPSANGQAIWVVFTQWHQHDPSTGRSPPVEFVVQDGWLRLGLNRVDNANPAESVRVGFYDLAPFKADVWHHWRAEIRWSLTDGSVKVWHDDNVVQDLPNVQTVFPISPSQLDQPGDSYLKVGVYRQPLPSTEPWVVWHDEFKRLEQGNPAQLPHPHGKLPNCLTATETPSIN
jgi:hypothetical protein